MTKQSQIIEENQIISQMRGSKSSSYRNSGAGRHRHPDGSAGRQAKSHERPLPTSPQAKSEGGKRQVNYINEAK
jgi:hypothetical protein